MSVPEKDLLDSQEAGTLSKAASKEAGDVTILGTALSADEDRRILRKIDLCLLPVLAASYLFQCLDKSAMNYTSILGLRTDLHMHGKDYSWASGVFYFGYLAFSFPASVLLVKFRVGKLLSASVFIWAAILMCAAASQNTAGLQATRFFLGLAEASIAPGFSIITSMWYKTSEQPLRLGAWFMGNVSAGFFGSLLAYAMGNIESIQPWRAVFLIFGGLTVVWSLALFFLIPDTPMNAWFLTQDDRAMAIERVKENKTGIRNDRWKPNQIVEALTDPKSWLLVLIQVCCNIPNGGITSFGSIVVQGLGFSTLNTLLVQMISVAFQAVFVITATGGSTYFKNTRTLWMALMLLIALVGTIMIREIVSERLWARFMGYCLLIAFSANFPMILTISASNVAGFTKKNIVNAMIFLAYCAANIVGPQLFFEDEAPGYTSGFLAMLVCFATGIILCFVLRFYLVWENKRRDKAQLSLSENPAEVEASAGFEDKTDHEQLSFRYVY